MAARLKASWRWLRTVRHFPVSALYHRLRLKIRRRFLQPADMPPGLPTAWRERMVSDSPFVWPLDFDRWLAVSKEIGSVTAEGLLANEQGIILNETFSLCADREALLATLAMQTPLWRENYGYLEFLAPLLPLLLHHEAARALMVRQCRLFWSLDFETRTWSTYGVARRVLFSARLLPALTGFDEPFQAAFWQAFYEDTDFLSRMLERDVRGNHLAKNLRAWLVATCILTELPPTQRLAVRWWRQLSRELPAVFTEQVLPDGFHFERTPMYHCWVLRDLLDCLAWLKACHPDAESALIKTLFQLAEQMLAVLPALGHSSGQLALFGDSSLLQTPDLALLTQYAQTVLAQQTGQALSVRSEDREGLTAFPEAGFCTFRQASPDASLVFDFGDFGPGALPAHSHCDLGSFELHVGDQPVLVDAGVSEYVPSLLRDYFRGAAAHNTLWVPGEEQAEIWGGFRVAEWPDYQGYEIEEDDSGAKVTLSYENYRHRYHHQRSIYHVARRFWVVQDWVRHLAPSDRVCFSLLHVHPDCAVQYEDEQFRLGERLLVIPYGARKIEWSNNAPWRQNLNLYAEGFSKARSGQVLALIPRLPDCFGWVLVPYAVGQPPSCEKLGESVELRFPDGHYRLTWDSEGLRVAFLAPTAGVGPG